MEYKIVKADELTHHGIKGQKWGIRRYQNKDGSLTKAGLKRRAKLEAELKQLGGKKKRGASNNVEAEQAPRKKTVSEMTDDELRDRTNRMQLESNYYNAARNLATANPVKVSKGKRFMNSLMNDVVAPAAKNAGKAWMEKFMKDKLGLNEKDPVDRLKKEAEKLKATKEIEEYKKQIKKLKDGSSDSDLPEIKTWDDVQKAQKYYEDQEKRRKEVEEDDD